MKEKILIIEDDPLIRNELKTLLQSNSYKTVAPEDFSDVIDQIKAEQPHLIILDIKLPVAFLSAPRFAHFPKCQSSL
jgi:DNA-binding response OmpR family regulator